MNGDLAKLVQMMQSSGLVNQPGNFSNQNNAAQSNVNGNAGQGNIDPALFASFFASQGSMPPSTNPNVMNLFQSAMSGSQNPLGAMGALHNPNNMNALMSAMQNMNMPSGARQTQWRNQYDRANPTTINQQPTPAAPGPQVNNPYRQRQNEVFAPNTHGAVNGKDFPEGWDKNTQQSYRSNFSAHHTPQDLNSGKERNPFPASGENRQPNKNSNRSDTAQRTDTPTNPNTSNEEQENPSPQSRSATAQNSQNFDINALKGENLDEFTQLFENFLEKENINTAASTPPNNTKEPSANHQDHTPPYGEYTGETQNNQNSTNAGGTPFGNMDFSNLFAMFQNMNGGSNQQTSAQGAQNSGNFGGANPFGNMDMGSMMGMLGAFGQGNQDDDKAKLLLALKPFLSPDRIQRVDSALQFIQLFKILPMFGQMT